MPGTKTIHELLLICKSTLAAAHVQTQHSIHARLRPVDRYMYLSIIKITQTCHVGHEVQSQSYAKLQARRSAEPLNRAETAFKLSCLVHAASMHCMDTDLQAALHDQHVRNVQQAWLSFKTSSAQLSTVLSLQCGTLHTRWLQHPNTSMHST